MFEEHIPGNIICILTLSTLRNVIEFSMVLNSMIILLFVLIVFVLSIYCMPHLVVLSDICKELGDSTSTDMNTMVVLKWCPTYSGLWRLFSEILQHNETQLTFLFGLNFTVSDDKSSFCIVLYTAHLIL